MNYINAAVVGIVFIISIVALVLSTMIEFNSNLIPTKDLKYNIGSQEKRIKTLYAGEVLIGKGNNLKPATTAVYNDNSVSVVSTNDGTLSLTSEDGTKLVRIGIDSDGLFHTESYKIEDVPNAEEGESFTDLVDRIGTIQDALSNAQAEWETQQSTTGIDIVGESSVQTFSTLSVSGTTELTGGIKNTTGNLVLENTNTTGKVQVKLGSTDVHTDFEVVNSDGTQLFNVDASGSVSIPGSFTSGTHINNTTITDQLIELGNGRTGTPSGDSGIVIERGDENNAFIGFDESVDKFLMGTGTITGASTGDLAVTPGTLVATLEGNITNTSGNLHVTSATNITEFRGDGSSVEGQIKLNCHNNSHGQTIKPQPHSESVTNILTLPSGENQELVGASATQILTNKTLTAPTITGNGTIAGVFTGDLTGTVNTATQNSITTMTGLTAVGSTGVNTTFSGPIVASEGVTANITGDLTGTVNTATQNSITTMTGLTAVGSTEVDTTFSGPIVGNEGVHIGGSNNELRFYQGTNYVGFEAPAALSADKIWVLPSADGTNGQALTTNGSGTLSWTTASGGGASSLNDLSDVLIESNPNPAWSSLYIGNDPSGSTSDAKYNIAVGTTALDAITTGDRNVAIGYDALTAVTTGGGNIAIGAQAGESIVTGGNNILLGPQVAIDLTGSSNIGIGYRAMYNLVSTTDNIAIGSQALLTCQNNIRNIAIGSDALKLHTAAGSTGDNVAIGYQAGDNITGGVRNVILGTGAGSSGSNDLTTGDNNIIIGYNAAASAATVDNEITLGNSSITTLRCADTTIASLSDRRDKTNIVDSNYGLEFINTLKPRQFTWETREKVPSKDGKTRVGFIAQELQEAMPNNENEILDLVYESNPDKLEAKYGNLVPILVKAIQELKEEINDLRNKIN